MFRKIISILLLLPAIPALARPGLERTQQTAASIQAPVLKWANAGCYSSWCETGWYSSPAIGDLDGDGAPEVIASAYSIVALNGSTGELIWRVASGHDRSEPGASNVGRTWPGIVLADLDGDKDLEIATAHGDGYLGVYDAQGYFAPGWPQRPVGNELRGLSAYDLDSDGDLELIATGAVYNQTNTWVYEHNGALRPGWPQLAGDSGYAHGAFNDNAAIGHLDGDGMAEIIVPSDVHYVCAYEPDGMQIPANPVYGAKGWGKVGVWEDLSVELRGWGTCQEGDARSERYRANFAHGPAAIADFNADGTNEVLVIGNVYDCISGYPSRYNGPYLFNADRSRFQDGTYDWSSTPVDTGAPLSEDYNLIENNQPNPAVADLDGDGELEIVYSSYDGRVHAFWLDKSEHGNWPYSVYKPSDGFYRFASEPVIADLDNDGHAEVLFASWVQKGTGQSGHLFILDYLGNVLQAVPLPPAYGGPDWNGALAAPTLGDIDDDPDLEVVLNTAHSGFVAYDLPGTANARILWGTGRGSTYRSGSLWGSLATSSKRASRTAAAPGETLTYTITLQNPGAPLASVTMTDTLPTTMSFAGNLSASSGTSSYAGGSVTWQGTVSGAPVTIRFDATLDPGLATPQAIINTAVVADGLGDIWTLDATTIANGVTVFLPLIQP